MKAVKLFAYRILTLHCSWGGWLQAHFQPMREAVRQLPRIWQLQGQLQLGAALQGTKQAPAMAHLSTPVSSGQPAAFTPPSGHTAVPLDRTYMPQGGEDLLCLISFLPVAFASNGRPLVQALYRSDPCRYSIMCNRY